MGQDMNAMPVEAIHHAHSLVLYLLAQEAHERAVAAVDTSPTILARDVIVVVILTAAAMEANVDEIAAGGRGTGVPELAAMEVAVRAVENEREPNGAMRKYEVAAEVLHHPFDKGRQPYQSGSDLMALRDAIVHVKSTVVRVADGTPDMPAVVRQLYQRKIARRPVLPEGQLASWLDYIQTPAVSEWAQRAALAMMRHLTEHLPTLPGDYERLRHRWDNTKLNPR